jgi:membrane-associated phospholipid phosphatase
MIRHAVSILLVLALACLAGCAKPGGEGAAVARPIIIDAPPRPWDTPRTKGVQFISDHYNI